MFYIPAKKPSCGEHVIKKPYFKSNGENATDKQNLCAISGFLITIHPTLVDYCFLQQITEVSMECMDDIVPKK